MKPCRMADVVFKGSPMLRNLVMVFPFTHVLMKSVSCSLVPSSVVPSADIKSKFKTIGFAHDV